MNDDGTQRQIAGLERRVKKIEGWRFIGGSSPTIVGTISASAISLSAASAILLTNASGRIVPGATSFLIRNNADAVTNLTLTDAGALTLVGAASINSGASDVESVTRRDNTSSTSTSGAVWQLTNRDTTTNNWVATRYTTNDSTPTLRNTAMMGAQVTARTAGTTSSVLTFATAFATLGVTNRMTVGASGEGADITGTSTVTVSAVNKKVLGLVSTSTADDPTEEVWQNRGVSTGNTQFTLATITIPNSTTVQIEATVIARRTGGASGTAEDGAGYRIIGTFQGAAGTAVQIGTTTVNHVAENQAGWDATFDVTGSTARIRCTGATANNITWHTTFRYMPVGS